MHDDRLLLEGRLNRFVHDHLDRAVHRASMSLTLEAWPAPGEPVPFADAIRQPFEPITAGTAWGKPWSTLWIHVTGEIPADWVGPSGSALPGTEVEVLVDLGFAGGPGFQAEALAWRPDGTTIKAVSPFNNHLPVTVGEPIDFYLEAAANPDVGNTGFRPTPNGDLATAVDVPLYVIERIDLVLRDVEAWELNADIWTLSGLLHELPIDLGPASRDPPRAAARDRRRRPRRLSGDGRGRTGRARRRPVPARVRERAQDGRGRPRPHRQRLVVAGSGDHPQVRADLLQRGRAGRRRPRLPVRVLVGPAVRVDEGVLSGAVRPDHREGGERPVHPGRRDVGRVRHQHARRGGDGSPVRGREVLLPRELRGGHRRGLVAGLVRLLRGAAADHRSLRVALVPHPEDLLEPDQQRCRTTASGGRASTAAGCSPTSRRRTPTTPRCRARSWRSASGSIGRRAGATPR